MNDKLLRQVIGGVVLLLVLVIVIRWFNDSRTSDSASQATELEAPAAISDSETRVYDIEPQPAPAETKSAVTPQPQAAPAPDVADEEEEENEETIERSEPGADTDRRSAVAAVSASSAETESPRVTAPKPADTTGKFMVQVGSYTTQSYADSLVKELRAAGYPAVIEEASMEGRKVYRVRVGPYGETTAREMAVLLKERLKQPVAVMRK